MLLVQLNKSSSFCGGSESFYHVLSFHMQLPEIHLGDLRIFKPILRTDLRVVKRYIALLLRRAQLKLSLNQRMNSTVTTPFYSWRVKEGSQDNCHHLTIRNKFFTIF